MFLADDINPFGERRANEVGFDDHRRLRLLSVPQRKGRVPVEVQLPRDLGQAKPVFELVKAFLLQVSHTQAPQEQGRNPTWFSVEEPRNALAKGREAKYAAELRTAIDRAVERLSGGKRILPNHGDGSIRRVWRSLLRLLGLGSS